VAIESQSLLTTLAEKHDDSHTTAMYEYLRWDVHYPVANLSSLIVPKETLRRTGLSKALIQGNFEQDRRDYAGTFAELVKSLDENPAAWGYLPLPQGAKEGTPYEPDPTSDIPPFELHLSGMKGKLEVPLALKNVVKIHWKLLAGPFYEVAQSMDVILPAFVKGGRYFDQVGSSTVATAVEVNVPLMATTSLRRSYVYLTDDVTIMRPLAFTEVQALRVLRTGRLPSLAPFDQQNARFMADLDSFIAKGWRRSTAGFEKAKAALWEKNEALMIQILNDEWTTME